MKGDQREENDSSDALLRLGTVQYETDSGPDMESDTESDTEMADDRVRSFCD